MAVAKVASDSRRSIGKSMRWFGRSMENKIEDADDQCRHILACDTSTDSLDNSCRLDVMLNLLDVNSRTLSTMSRHSPLLTEFMNCFIATHTSLLRDNSSPLLDSDRFFIALMAAEVSRCHSLVCMYANEFLLHRGDVQWLKGLCGNNSSQSTVPRKFHHLSEINELLAHSPWMITKNHIAKLAAAQEDRWSMSALIQAVIILAHVHSLSSLLAGFRLIPNQSASAAAACRKSQHGDATPYTKLRIGDKGFEVLHRRLSDRSGVELVEKFLNNPGMSCAELIQKRCEQIGSSTLLSPQYFSWEAQGYSLANMTNVQFGDLIDEELRSMRKLFDGSSTHHHSEAVVSGNRCHTSNLIEKVSSEVSDSQKYHAVWQFVHCLLGICYEDYKHSQIDVFLSTDLRSYIKLVTCCPERLSEDRFQRVVQSISDCEKISVHAIVAEARLQVELMFCLSALLDYHTESGVAR